MLLLLLLVVDVDVAAVVSHVKDDVVSVVACYNCIEPVRWCRYRANLHLITPFSSIKLTIMKSMYSMNITIAIPMFSLHLKAAIVIMTNRSMAEARGQKIVIQVIGGCSCR